jgi:hypothetical protein
VGSIGYDKNHHFTRSKKIIAEIIVIVIDIC